jgi:hypothetical protein
MKTKLLFFTLAILLLTISCKKEKDDSSYDPNYHEPTWQPAWTYDSVINPHLLQDFLFNKGTWWVYQDSLTAIIDTCIVDSVVSENYGSGQPPYIMHRYVYNIKTGDFPTGYLLHGNVIFASLTDAMDSVDSNGDFYMNDNVIFCPLYTIDTAVYTDVYKIFFRNPCGYIYIPDSGYYYMKAGIGIIKSEYYIDGQRSVYELVDYHIN